MWSGGGRRQRSKSGYGHTAVQQIIIGFVKTSVMSAFQPSSLEEDEPANRLQSSERCRHTDRDTRTDKTTVNKLTKPLHLWTLTSPSCLFEQRDSEPSA